MIYWRQKVLVTLLEKAPDKSASKSQFIKWLFLLKKEEKIDRYGIFYDFLPYKYGPFSFLAYKEIPELERFGWIKSSNGSLHYTVPEPEFNKPELKQDVTRSILTIIENYGKLSLQRLIRYVYENYPWYASRSSIGSLTSSFDVPEAQPGIYSLGYEGLSIDAFLNIILRSGIRAVVDSRSNPVSRKYSFSKSDLKKRCVDLGLKYYHFSEVGIPPKFRNQVQHKQALWNLYTQKILPEASETLRSIIEICRKAPAVLICFEEKPEECHRHILAGEISKRTGLPIVHYNSKEEKWDRK